MALSYTASLAAPVERLALFSQRFSDSEVDFWLFTIRPFHNSAFLDCEYSHLNLAGGKHAAWNGEAILGARSDSRPLNICRAVDF